MMTTSRNPDVKADRSMMRMFRTVLAMGCLGALVAGCAAPAPSQKIYNRYEALLASRNQMLAKQQPATTAPAPVAEKPAEIAAPRLNRPPLQRRQAGCPEAPRKPAAPALARPSPRQLGNGAARANGFASCRTAASPVQPPPRRNPSARPETGCPPHGPVWKNQEPKPATSSRWVMVQVYLRGIPRRRSLRDVIDE